MKNRESFRIYKILEDYSKEFISFEYSPEFKLPTNYHLLYDDINNILVENSKLIKSLYSRDEDVVSLILNKED